MIVSSLPTGHGGIPEVLPHFPTRWQAVLWRNWELVPLERLASVLQCTQNDLKQAASGMGLSENGAPHADWLKHGYLTVIRNNWHLLPYSQMLELLGWSAQRMAHALNEEDFLWLKLGAGKPDCSEVRFEHLTPQQQQDTAILAKTLQKHFPQGLPAYQEKPFAFLKGFAPIKQNTKTGDFDFNFIAPYSTSCGDILNEDEPFPDNLLAQYASSGVQGLWIHSILYLLCPIPGAEEFSTRWEIRRQKLQELAEKCAKHGVQLYLYLNEPRSLPMAFYEKKPLWAGLAIPELDTCTICTNRSPEPLTWLENAMRELWRDIPQLGGAFCITMSENPTNCHYRAHSDTCPVCKAVPPAQIIADILTAMERGMHASAPKARMIASTWGWQRIDREIPDIPADVAFAREIMELLPQSIYIATVSENSKELCIGEVCQRLGDYSISQVGPSEKSCAIWKAARECGLRTIAKIQVNNSWELAAVPYLPVPFLVQEHLRNLKHEGISGVMLSWTQGGYPGGNIELLFNSVEQMAEEHFGKYAKTALEAWRLFSCAFRELPFGKNLLYCGPTNYGPKNRLYSTATGRHATMLGFPYDDLKGWRGYYPEEIFESQFAKLVKGWQDGLAVLDTLTSQNEALAELRLLAEAALCHFASTLNQIQFVLARNARDKKRMNSIAVSEIALAKKLMTLAAKDSRIGFEASNHYFYTQNDLLEKIISCEHLINMKTE